MKRQRKILSLVIIFAMIFSLAGGIQSVEAASLESDFTFDPDTGTITGYIGDGGAVEIPATIGGVAVTQIGDFAFKEKFKVTSVTIPYGVTSIGMSAFVYCNKIKSVTLPDTLETIGTAAFQGCDGLRSVVIPASVTTIGDVAFSGLDYYGSKETNMTQAVFLGNAPSMGKNVFYYTAVDFKIYYPDDKTGYTTSAWDDYSAMSYVYDPDSTYTLSYDGNGGATGFETVDSLHTGDIVVVPEEDDSFVYDGYLFDGWTTSAGGTGEDYYEGSVVPIGVDDITLYAQWKTAYQIDIDTLEHGFISADRTLAAKGDEFFLTITSDDGWNYVPGSLGFKDPTTGDTIADIDVIETTDPMVKKVEMPACDILVTAKFAEGNFLYETTGSAIKITRYIGTAGDIVIPSSIDGKPVTTLGKYICVEDGSITSVTIPSTVTSIEQFVFLFCRNLKSISLEGDAPDLNGGDNFVNLNSDLTIYYYEGSNGYVGSDGFLLPEWSEYHSVALYRVTFDKNGGDTEMKTTTMVVEAPGKALGTLPKAPSKSGYTFSGWNTAANGSGTAFTKETVVTSPITVYAQWTKNSSGGDGDSSSGGSGSRTPAVPTVPAAKITETAATGNSPASVTSTTTAESKADSKGNAVASVSESQLADAINLAVEAAAKKGINTQVKVAVKVTAPSNAKSVETSMLKAAFTAVADGKTDELTVSTPIGSMTFDGEALSTIGKEMAGDVKITVSKVDSASLSEEAKQTIEDRPVFNLSVTSGNKTISQFGGNVTVSVPYTLKAGEDTNAIIIYYINAEGKPEMVRGCKYDPATRSVMFTTSHFSMYAVGYNKISFEDVAANAWYSNAVGFVAARDISTGTVNGKFSPEEKLTRGQFLVMVMRAYGIKPDENAKENFADAGNTYYTDYLAAAKSLGITDGIGDNKFAPKKEITRQEMAALLYNTLDSIDELPEGTAEKSLSDFGDANQVAPWAKDAMTLFVKTGIITGSGDQITPASTSNRAQMAQILYNLLSQ